MSRQHPTFALSILLLLCIGLTFLFLAQPRLGPAIAQTGTAADGPNPFAVIKTIVVGTTNRDEASSPDEVTIIHDDKSVGAKTGMLLYAGDQVTTKTGVKLTILFLDDAAEKDNEVLVYSDTHIQLGSVFTWAGTILARVKDKFAAKTTRTQCSVQGTEYQLTVDKNGTNKLLVLKGEVKFETGTFKPTVAGNPRSKQAFSDAPMYVPAAFSEPAIAGQQKAMEFVAISGRVITIEREFILTNSCQQQHLYKVASPVNLNWFQFLGADRFAVAGHGSRRISFAIRLDGNNVPVGPQKSEIVFPCLDCNTEPGCGIGGLLLPIIVNVVSSSGTPSPSPSPTETFDIGDSANVARMQEVILLPAGNLQKTVASVPEVDEALNWSNGVILSGEPTYSAQSVVPRFRTAEERNRVFREVRRSSILNNDRPSTETLADIYIDWGDGAKAEEELKRLVTSSQESPERLTSLGESYRLMGDLRTAERLLQQAINLDPNSATAQNALGNVYLDQAKVAQDQNNVRAARGFLEKANAEYTKALHIQPATPPADLNHARAQTPVVISSGQTATVALSNLGEVHLRLGELAKNQGRRDEALTQFRMAEQKFGDAARTDQSYQFAYSGLGDTYRELGETFKASSDSSSANSYFVKAKDQYTRALKLHNDMAEAYVGVGKVLDDTGKHDEARMQYLKATQVRPELPDPHFHLAVSLSEIDPERAAEQARAFLKIERAPLKQGDKAKIADRVIKHLPVPQRTVSPFVGASPSPSPTETVVPSPSPSPTETVVPSPSPLVKVPHVNGDRPDQAQRKMRERGLESEIQEKADCKVNGRVVSTSPARDQKVPKGSKVIVFISAPGEDAVTVPTVTNMQLNDAERELRNVRLRSKVGRRVETDSVPENTVLSQKPSGGRLPPDCQVELTISYKVQPVPVPQFVGMTKEQAFNKLPKYSGSLIRGTVTEVESNQAPGMVIDQFPAAGTMVRPGTSVNLVISASPTVQVPDLRGMKEQQARQYIENMRGLLKLGTVTPQLTDDCKLVGKVTDQSPPPHQKVKVGTEINLVVLQRDCVILFQTARDRAAGVPGGLPRNLSATAE